MTTVRENPLASKPVGSLLVQFAVPSIVSMLLREFGKEEYRRK